MNASLRDTTWCVPGHTSSGCLDPDRHLAAEAGIEVEPVNFADDTQPNPIPSAGDLDPVARSDGGRAPRVARWKPALNAFAITFTGRFEKTTQ